MPNYRGPTIDDLVYELGSEFAILPRGGDGKYAADNDKLIGLLEKDPPQYLVRRLNFYRLSQASLKNQLRLANRHSSGFPSVDVTPIPVLNVEGPLKPYRNYVAGLEPQFAPVHALDLVYEQIREADEPVRNKLHPDLVKRGALVVNLHQDRVPPRSASAKRGRDPSQENVPSKKGKGGNQQPPATSSSSASASGKSKAPAKKDPKSKDGEKSAPTGKTRSKSKTRQQTGTSETQSQAGSQASQASQSTRGRGRGAGRGVPKKASGTGGNYRSGGW